MRFCFRPTKFEGFWLRDVLGGFSADGWFTDVLYRVKGGKEANVYCCKANPGTGLDLIAAKVYRHRGLRAMKNDTLYREGRQITSDRRSLRALKKKTKKGRRVETGSWLACEYQAMERLYDIGADVPQPFAQGSHVILMEYFGDESLAAPALNEIALEDDEARHIFDRLMENVELLLACDLVHGDLSAYNVLYHEGRAVVIDFPQAVRPMDNPSAFSLLVRDIERLVQYFSRHGIVVRPIDLAEDLWERYMRQGLYASSVRQSADIFCWNEALRGIGSVYDLGR